MTGLRSPLGSADDKQESFRIRFTGADVALPDQDEESFEFDMDGERRRLRIHDYAEIFAIPGLYEALVYDKLQCNSPRRLVEVLSSVLVDRPEGLTSLRVLDLGAGNGIVAEELRRRGVESVLGLDLLPEAEIAARRDRPGVYDDFIVADLCDLAPEDRQRIADAKLNCLVTVAALGFGDIPPDAFATAFNLIAKRGWIGMTIKEDFLDPGGDDSGFARLIRRLMERRIIEVQAHLRFLHRLSITGERIYYMAIVARKTAQIPRALLDDATGNGDTHVHAEAATGFTHLIRR